MTDRLAMGLRRGGKSTSLDAMHNEALTATLEAADQVACEFEHPHRQAFLIQAVQREFPGIDPEAAARAAKRYVAREA